MSNIFHKHKKGIILGILVFIIVVVSVCGLYSFLNPYDKCGYKTLFIDSKSHVYDSGDKFYYGQYQIQVSIKRIQVAPVTLDCNDDTFYWILTKSQCEQRNVEYAKDAKKYVNIEVSYTVNNITNQVMSLSNGWLKVYDSQGQKIKEAPNGLQLVPSGMISKTLKIKELEKTKASPISVIVSLPMRAKQTILLK